MTTRTRTSEYVEEVKQRFLAATGLTDVRVFEEPAGLESFLRIEVGRDAPFYRTVLGRIDDELAPDNPFYGALTLQVNKPSNVITSLEVELLRSLIARSLRITTKAAQEGLFVDFAPFRGGEEKTVSQPANNAILGRRGVGKSSLILTGYRRILTNGHLPIWIDLQPYRGRNDPMALLGILCEFLEELSTRLHEVASDSNTNEVDAALQKLENLSDEVSLDEVQRLAPSIRGHLRKVTRNTHKDIFLFVDDAHVVHPELQPYVFDFLHGVLKGVGGWLKVAGVRNLLRLYEPASKLGLQVPNDVQTVSLDLTLVDPGAARDQLANILKQFLYLCGFTAINVLIPSAAINRLVWCSAGVPRDFLWLFDRSIAFAIQHRKKKVGVQEVNSAVGEFGQQKMEELEQDASNQGEALRDALERVKNVVLDDQRTNSFLVMQDTKHPGYIALQKLVDLRLVHLIHPSITPSRAGKRYEAYLLDYSFYTGLRRRHNMRELKINVNEPPKYDELRNLPKLDLSVISPSSVSNIEVESDNTGMVG
ncbi:MAG: hypothetical protein ACLFV4_13915 [Candidatus Hydrogenedentota bacterium]